MKSKSQLECPDCNARETNVFCRLGANHLGRLSNAKTNRVYQKKQSLYYEGAPAQGIYCLHSGEAKVFKTSSQGKQHILRIAHAGQILGLEDVFCRQDYSTSAEMIGEGAVCFIDRSAVMEIIRINPETAAAVIRELSEEVVASEEERVELAQSTVRERMARLLAVLAESHGAPSRGGVQIQLPLSREEMAEMIGTASETAMRLLKEFRDDHLVQVRGREITILNRARLMQVAHITP